MQDPNLHSVDDIKREMRELSEHLREAGGFHSALCMKVRNADIPTLRELTSASEGGDSVEVLITSIRLNLAWADKAFLMLREAILARARELTNTK